MDTHEFDADGTDASGSYSDDIARLLSDAHSVRDVDRLFKPDADATVIADFVGARKLNPDKPIILTPYWMPIFSGACETFGMQEAMVKMAIEQ